MKVGPNDQGLNVNGKNETLTNIHKLNFIKKKDNPSNLLTNLAQLYKLVEFQTSSRKDKNA